MQPLDRLHRRRSLFNSLGARLHARCPRKLKIKQHDLRRSQLKVMSRQVDCLAESTKAVQMLITVPHKMLRAACHSWQVDDLKDKLARSLADMENLRDRTARASEQSRNFAIQVGHRSSPVRQTANDVLTTFRAR